MHKNTQTIPMGAFISNDEHFCTTYLCVVGQGILPKLNKEHDDLQVHF